SAGRDSFRACLEEVAADDGVDAVLVVTVPTAIAELTQAITTARVGKPLVASVLDQPQAVLLRPAVCDRTPDADRPAAAPVYACPGGGARGLGHGVRYRAGRARRRGRVPDLDGVRTADARAQIAGFLAASPNGGWLPPAAVSGLLACYGIPLAPGGQ